MELAIAAELGQDAASHNGAASMKLGLTLYFGDFVAAPAAIAAVSAAALAGATASAAGLWLAALAAGFALWTLIEYAVHAWVYHRLPWFEQGHAAHHDDPTALIGAPSFLIVAGLLLIGHALFPLAGAAFCAGLSSGLLAGYLGYMTIHHMSHHARPGRLLAAARARHMAHHYRGGATNFGVTTAFWDHVFQTASGPRARTAGI